MTGLPHHQSAENPPPSTPTIVTMEVREGRIGNAFACERCRKHKVRCVPSDTSGVCQRCQKARVECIEHVARRRPAKPRPAVQTPNRVAEMERKLDKLSAMVIATPSPASTGPTTSTLPPVATLPSQSSDVGQRTSTPASITSAPPVMPVTKASILPNPGSNPESALSFWDSINDTISGLGRLDPIIRTIGVAHMQSILESYRTMVDFFPFVPLPKECFCRDLLQQRPILMFAVLTAASRDSTLLQLTLSREFRKVVMVKIMNGEKSLDLLQGLLVFIAWHHHYMDLHSISISMLLQICLGVASDLKLESIPPAHAKEHPQDREARRAYLGCYYLSTNIIALEGSKGHRMAHSSALHEYAAALASAWEFKTDTVLSALIDNCQFLEDVEDTFRIRSEEALSARTQAKRLTQHWNRMRSASRQVPINSKTLHWAQLASQIYMYKSASSLDLLNPDSVPWVSGFQLSLRVNCVSAIEQFLDNAAQLGTAQYEYLSLVDWLNLILVLTNLGNLALHTTPMPGWDPADLQISKTFEHFRDKLCAQLPRPRDVQEHGEDIFERFRRITAIMKMALRHVPGRGSPTGSTFEITSSSRQAVSILQDLPPLQPNGGVNGSDSLPAPWKVNPSFDMSSDDFAWKFLMGAV